MREGDYSAEAQAVRLRRICAVYSGNSVTKMARDLGVQATALHNQMAADDPRGASKTILIRISIVYRIAADWVIFGRPAFLLHEQAQRLLDLPNGPASPTGA